MSSEGSDFDGSDIQIQSALPKMTQKKLPTSPSDDILKKKLDKNLTTKIMIIEALVDLKSRKGVSLYAIKKYIAKRYNVDTEKLNYHIKKSIKSAVEKGVIIQTKGIGATGSFKLAPIKEMKPKTKKPKKEKTEKTKDPGKKKKLKEKTKDPEKKKKLKEKTKKTEGKSLKSKVKSKESKEDKPVKPKKKMDADKKQNEKKDGGEKTKKVRIAKVMQTPPKKKGMMKRKSIGSIIKPPKMKPRAKA